MVMADNKLRTAARNSDAGVESLFLGLNYREGSSMHPSSLPAGLAIVTGARSTMLKAMLPDV